MEETKKQKLAILRNVVGELLDIVDEDFENNDVKPINNAD